MDSTAFSNEAERRADNLQFPMEYGPAPDGPALTIGERELCAGDLRSHAFTVPPETTCNEVFELMEADQRIPSLAVVEHGAPVGLINRTIFLSGFSLSFRRELFGRKSCIAYMDKSPLVVDHGENIHEVARKAGAFGAKVLSDGLIVTCGGSFYGAVTGIELLRAMNVATEKRGRELSAVTHQLASTGRSMNGFLATLRHELSTPLNAILGFGQVLKMDDSPTLGQQQLQCVDEILKAAWHLCDLVKEVVDLGSIQMGAIELSVVPVELMPLVEDCVTVIRHGFPAPPVRIHVERPGFSAAVLLADRLRLRQVLLNLLSNAVKYNKAEGEVRLSCSLFGQHARLVVEDTGLGIPPDKQAEVFQMFNRLGRENSGIDGTGIGLALCKRYVEAMGGALGFESVPGEGSAFWVDLPVSSGGGN